MWKWIRQPLKEVGKMLAVLAVEGCGDLLQEELAKESGTVKAFDRCFDKAQAWLVRPIERNSWIPKAIGSKALEIVKDEGDKFQAAARGAILAGKPELVNRAFDSWQAALTERIRAL